MEKFDIIVVGGGPAGGTVARLLSKKGFKVLLIEKEKPPREKLCAGAVSLRAERYLPPEWDTSALNEIYGGNLGWKGEKYISARFVKTVVKIVDRASFDLFLSLKAQDEGAKGSFGEKFLNFRNHLGEWGEGETGKGSYKTRYLVGADGVLSQTLKGWGYKRNPVAVLEALVETQKAPTEEVYIDIGLVKWGYAWIFPKGEGKVSVGIASLKKEKRNLRRLLENYIKRHPLLEGGKLLSLKGWFIYPSKGSLIKGEGKLFFVGDASGSVDPLLGEGIYYSLWQAHILADCLTEREPQRCYRKKLKPLEGEFFFGYLTGFLAYNFQQFMFKNAKPRDLEEFFRFLRGERNFQNIFLYGAKRFLKSLFKVNF